MSWLVLHECSNADDNEKENPVPRFQITIGALVM